MAEEAQELKKSKPLTFGSMCNAFVDSVGPEVPVAAMARAGL